jgi:exopolysaccharide biosynthesis polyprenyl glycosylphosphotransferase
MEAAVSDSRRQNGQPAAALKISRRILLALFRRAGRVAPFYWMMYDAFAAAFTYFLVNVTFLRHVPLSTSKGAALLAGIAVVVTGLILGLYERRILRSRINIFLVLCATTIADILAISLFTNLVLYKQVGRKVLLLSGLDYFALAILPRYLAHYAIQLYKTRILAIADRPQAETIAARLRAEEDCYVFVGYCGERREESREGAGAIEDIPRICQEQAVDQIVVTSKYLENPTVLSFCFQAARIGCEIEDENSFYEDFLEQVQVQLMDKGVFFSPRIGRSTRLEMFIKRAMDVVIALIGLILAAPLFPLVWILARMASGGRAIFAQERCGQFGEPFTMLKFRTMRESEETDGPHWTSESDPRLTRIGRFLRKTRLDEIPQFWNILKGDMSFVGPRPERPDLVREIEKAVPHFSFRNWARPGLTGLAQIRFRYGASIEDAREKLRYDLYYIKNWSLFLDVKIILRTLSMMMKGAR